MAPDRTTGRDPPQRREARFAKRRCLHPGGLLPGCQERRPRRDRGGATGTVAASPGFRVRDGSPPGRPFAGMPGAQATARQRRRDRNGRCKPGVSRQGWKPARAETAPLAPFTTARPARGTPGKGISRRTTKQTVIRAAEKRRTVAVAVAVAVAGTTTSVTNK